jgi:hypothetical protein
MRHTAPTTLAGFAALARYVCELTADNQGCDHNDGTPLAYQVLLGMTPALEAHAARAA